MKVSVCPICGRKPIIIQCMPYKNGTQRRMCKCPRLDSVVPHLDNINRPWFIYVGDGDDNAIFTEWNKAIARYLDNKSKDWFNRDYSKWSNNSSIELW